MRFSRYHREAHVLVSPQRIAAANRKVARDKAERDSLLFPELSPVKFKTGEEYVAACNNARVTDLAEWRLRIAHNWRRARAQLFAMPAISRKGIVRYWNECSLPGDPVYLLSLIRECRHESGWTKLRKLCRFKLISAGKLPRPTRWEDL